MRIGKIINATYGITFRLRTSFNFKALNIGKEYYKAFTWIDKLLIC